VAANAALGARPILAEDTPLYAGLNNTTSLRTTITGTVPGDKTLLVTNGGTGMTTTALEASADAGVGVQAYTVSGPAAIRASASGPAATAIRAYGAATGTGVYGVTDGGTPATNTTYTGVYGYADVGTTDVAGCGVWGDSPDYGVCGTGFTGVLGISDNHVDSVGVEARGSGSGTGLWCSSETGAALHTVGKIVFQNRSGRNSVKAGAKVWTKSGLVGVTSSSTVIAVLQTPETGTWVRAAVASSGRITVYFNRALPTSSYVGWLIVN
jgi:hypothetical protein